MFYANSSVASDFRAEASTRTYFKLFNFYLQLHILRTFHWDLLDLLGEAVKIATEDAPGWQHRTSGSQLQSSVQNSAQNGKLHIYLARRWGEN